MILKFLLKEKHVKAARTFIKRKLIREPLPFQVPQCIRK